METKMFHKIIRLFGSSIKMAPLLGMVKNIQFEFHNFQKIFVSQFNINYSVTMHAFQLNNDYMNIIKMG